MATIKGVIFNNRQSFDGMQTAVYNYYLANVRDVDTTIVKRWSDGIDALDGSGDVLMLVDERVLGFPWNPHAVVDISTDNPKWFNNEI